MCLFWQEDQKNESHFHIVVSCIAQSLKSQIINRSYDEVAICFFNTVRFCLIKLKKICFFLTWIFWHCFGYCKAEPLRYLLELRKYKRAGTFSCNRKSFLPMNLERRKIFYTMCWLIILLLHLLLNVYQCWVNIYYLL